nr:C. briggsae CBR-SCD-1 protein [Haemonchus contortus]
MMTYLNNCMSNIKSTLNTNGLPIGIDANGRAVDYSSRPIDPIFQQARAKMEDARDFQKNSSSGSTAKSSCTAASKDYGIICTSATALPTISLYSVPSQASVQPEINQIDAKIFFAETINVADGNDLESPPEKRMLIASEVELL